MLRCVTARSMPTYGLGVILNLRTIAAPAAPRTICQAKEKRLDIGNLARAGAGHEGSLIIAAFALAAPWYEDHEESLHASSPKSRP